MQARALSLFALAALTTACAGNLPEPIYANQVDAYFPEPTEGGAVEATPPDATAVTPVDEEVNPTVTPTASASVDVQHELRLEAGHCAARLNGHRDTAETVSIIQGIISGIGGVTGGVGSALTAVHFDSTDINTAMAVMGSVGAGITFVGNLVLGFVANPLEELRRQGQGLRSWELAVELQLAHADAEAIRASLQRCAQDLGPEQHVVGSGEAFHE